MIHFNCPKCGKGFTVSEDYSGKKAKCSRCKSVIIIPFEKDQPLPNRQQEVSLPTNKDNRDIPPELQKPDFLDNQPAYEKAEFAETKDQQQEQKDFTRRLPWFIDIFLYPLNLTGLIMIAILAGVPFIIEQLPYIMNYLGGGNVILWFLSMIIVFVGFFIVLAIALYKYWYFCYCIQDSAEGNIRIPQKIGDAPDLGELFSGLKNVGICLIAAFAPAIIYGFATKQLDRYFFIHFLVSAMPHDVIGKYMAMDLTFYLLLGWGVIIFPMGLLSITMHDSIWGLNPIILIFSIFKTFFKYIGVVMIFLLFFLMIQYIHYRIYFQRDLFVWYCRRFIIVYFSLIVAHLLGRFYYTNSQKLNWYI